MTTFKKGGLGGIHPRNPPRWKGWIWEVDLGGGYEVTHPIHPQVHSTLTQS